MFLEKLVAISNNNELKASEKSISQVQRNKLVNELTDSLLKDFIELYKPNEKEVYNVDYIRFAKVDNKTIEFEIDNESIGIIPLKISVSLPNFNNDEDLFSKVEDYKESIRLKQEKEIEKKKSKEEKIKIDEKKRKEKELEKELEKKVV